MITPIFEISQDETFLYIKIRAPYAKISETEIEYHDSSFFFYSKPYYLRLHLPGKLQEGDQDKATYNSDTGWFTVCVTKQNPEEEFKDLDMLTKLLQPPGKDRAEPLIEITGGEEQSSSNFSEDTLHENSYNDDEDNPNWFLKQEIASEEIVNDGPKYGFGNLRSGVFKTLREELNFAVDVKNPDSVNPEERRHQKQQHEEEKFDCDYYLADLFDNPVIGEVLKFRPDWYCGQIFATFSDEEKEIMRNLPRREYLLDSEAVKTSVLSLVDIIYAFAYDYRSTFGENTVESGWTICKLSGTLSWLETFNTLPDVAESCFRRALCFPLYRHWKLCVKVLQDTKTIFEKGRKCILKCLLKIYQILKKNENYYIMNDLYIIDYCVWLQRIADKALESVTCALQKITVKQNDIGFDLEELELAGKLTLAEEEEKTSSEIASLSQSLAGISLNPHIKEEIKESQSDSDDEDTLEEESSSEESSLDSDDTESSCSEQDANDHEESKKTR